MDKIEKIRKEIERRKSLLTQHSKLTYDLILETFIKEYDSLLSFLDTLSEEPVSEELEAEIQNMLEQYAKFTDGRFAMLKPSGLEKIARHFAKWGAEHLKK